MEIPLALSFAFGASDYGAAPSTAVVLGAVTQSSDQKLATALLPMRSDFPKYYSTIIRNPCSFAAPTNGAVTARASLRLGGPNSMVWAVATVFKSEAVAQRFYRQTVSCLPRCAVRFVKRTPTFSSPVLQSFSYGRLGDESRAWRIRFSWIRSGIVYERPADLVAVRVARAVAYYTFFNIFPDAHGNDFGQTRRNEAIVH